MIKTNFQDKQLRCINGFFVLFVVIMLAIFLLANLYNGNTLALPTGCVLAMIILACPSAIFINSPNEAKVVEFFGSYIGTLSQAGLFFSIPFTRIKTVSLKINNINTEIIKVNDFNGNPIEISAVIVWKVIFPAKACLNVMNYREFVAIQSETALRELAGSYPYDSHDGQTESLQRNSQQISSQLKNILQLRLEIAGIEVEDSKISHLAYSAEIAKAMLKKQQAQAIISARIYIVKNAVSMVEEVLAHFEHGNTVELSTQQKVNLINNLLVSLLSEQGVQPTINID